jgi:chaperonin GroES
VAQSNPEFNVNIGGVYHFPDAPDPLAIEIDECQFFRPHPLRTCRALTMSRSPPGVATGPAAGAQTENNDFAIAWRTKMKFRPLHDRVVVKRIDAESKTAGGIIIPDTAQEKPQQGEVIAVGPGGRDEAGKLIPLDVKAGDIVLFGKWSGTEVKIDGQDLLIMKESDIMGVMDATAAKKKAA